MVGSARIHTLPESDLVDASEKGSGDDGAAPFAAGTMLAGKYLLEREIAEGGLGIVIRATHVELNQPVAIKFLKPHVLANPVLVERFKREAQLAASIRSDHVVRVLDVGNVQPGGPFMVMELLEGEDLGSMLMQGPLPTEIAVDYVIQACDALAEAHALGIVHRDLKPENLFVVRRKNTSPIVKILDFGISKTYERKKILEGAPRVRQMTEAGDRFGTPLYMSPEQLIKTSEVDARADIWALGVMLYELVSGQLPFDGDTVVMYTASVVSMPALPLRARLPNAHVGLEAVLAKCLEKRPDDRYRNVGELVVELVTLVAPGSKTRTDRIKRFVLEGGESIRPPRPLSQPDLTLSELPHLAFTPVTAATNVEVAGVPRARNLGLLFAGMAALICASLLAAFFFLRKPDVAPAPLIASSAALPAETAPVALPTPPPETDAPSALPVAPPVTSGAATTRAPASRPSRPAPPPTPAKRTDYNEFGDRH